MSNFPLFTPSAATSLPTTTKGDLIVYDGAANVRQPVGVSNGQVLKVNSATSTGIEWGSASASLAVRSVTTTDSPTNADDVLLLSSASFTVTLFTAVGNTGKVLTIIHQGTSLSQIYTMATTGGQTIGGVISGNYILYTNSESIQIVSDGANWRVIEHNTTTAFVSSGTTTFTATTSSPTKSSTVTVDDVSWRRDGDQAQIWYRYTQTGTTSAAAGSGDYILAIPSNMTVDTTRIQTYTTAPASGGFEAINAAKAHINGTAWINNGTSRGDCQFFLYSTTSFRINVSIYFASNAPWGSGRFQLNGSGIDFNAIIQLPISGWLP